MTTLEHLLDLCLAQLYTGNADLATVLAQYPEQRAALEPMLRAALAVQRRGVVQPRLEAQAAGRERLATALVSRLSAEALDHAWLALKSGQDPATALADSPYAAEILPLLRLAQVVEQTPEPLPRLEAQAVGYARLITAVEARRRFLANLDEALVLVSAGQSVAQALAHVGSDAKTIEPMVRVAQAIQQTPQPTINPQAKAAGLARLKQAMLAQRELEPILDRALADVRRGLSIETVLARYPLYATALEPLLRPAQSVEATPHPSVSPAAKAEGLTRVLAAVEAKRELDTVVDRALADLRAGLADIPMLLARYREHAEVLEPILLSAHYAQNVPLPQPRLRAQTEGRTRLMAAVSAKRAQLVAEKLDRALARIHAGESLSAVLAGDPDFQAELEPLLRTALAVERTPAPAVKSQARENGERQLIRTAHSRRLAKHPIWAPLAVFVRAFTAPRGMVRQAFIAAVALMFFVSSTVIGVTRAAAFSLPDDTLYPVKLVTEQVQIALTNSPEARAQLHVAFAQERLREVQAATAAGRDPQRALAQLPRHTESAQALVDQVAPEVRDRVEAQLQTVKAQERQVFAQIQDKLTPEVRTLLGELVATPTAQTRAQVVATAATATAIPATVTTAPTAIPPTSTRSSASEAPAVAPPTKTPLPLPSATASAPIATPVIVFPTQAPTQAPVETQPPAPPATEAPAPTATPRQVIQPGGGRSATRTPEPTNTAQAVTNTPVSPATSVAPTATRTPAPLPTNTPVTPVPTVVAPPTRGPRQTSTPAPVAPSSTPGSNATPSAPGPAATNTPHPASTPRP